MTLKHKYPLINWAFLIVLSGLTLVACSTADNLRPSSGDAGTSLQAVNAAEWDAATFFASTCASCHGAAGQGTAVAPALNGEVIRTADTGWLIEIISNGRSGTAMPAWSEEFGGPLTSEQIAEMAAFLKTGNWDKASEIAADQPVSPMGPGMMGGHMRGGMMRGEMMDGGMGNGRMP